MDVSPHRSLLLMGFLTLIGTGVGVYIMAMAVLSPCPLLVNEASGGVIMVSITVAVRLFLNSTSILNIENKETHLHLVHRCCAGSSSFSLCPM